MRDGATRCYTMIGYDGETILDAAKRLERVLALGFLPFTFHFTPKQNAAPT
jgi:hypothetical protein